VRLTKKAEEFSVRGGKEEKGTSIPRCEGKEEPMTSANFHNH